MEQDDNRRILLIDDTPAIHDDFRKILVREESPSGMEQMEAVLFGATARSALPEFELECACQGQEGLTLLRRALQAGKPYAVAFVDMRMPPGWNGVQTIEHLWLADPRLQVVICTAYADHSWDEILNRLAVGDRLLILKKPFDAVEVRQLAGALSAKWNASRQAELKMAQLEKLVQVRNCQLESLNLDLLRARDAAKAASRVKSEFLANMSHEIRTPMNALLGMTHLALQTELTPRQQQYLDTAKGAAESLMQTINDILDFSIMESGKLELELGEFLLAEVLERLSAVMAEKAQLKQLRLEIEAAPECCVPLIGDPYRLGQVLINLCDNAVKFTDYGQVRVRVRTTGEATDRLTLCFSVSDTGGGIAPAELERLFHPFSQLDASSTRKNGGAGMGLAISKKLVQLMGGELKAVSQAGSGSEFSFCVSLELGTSMGMLRPESAGVPGKAGLPELPALSGSRPFPGAEPAGARPAGEKMLDQQAVKWMLDQMTALFDCDLDRALALKEQLHAELDGTIVAQEFARMERLIEKFDFEGASKSRERIDSILDRAREQAP